MGEDRTVFLLNAYKSIPDVPELETVKSHLMWLCKEITGKKASCETVSNTFGPWSSCPNCCHLWSNGKFSLSLKPSGTCGSRMAKILRKYSAMPEKLNSVEVKLFKRHSTAVNKLVLTCSICQKETVVPIKKPRPRKTPKCEVVEDVQLMECESNKKKRKKKDLFAGLNVSAVMSASPSPIFKRKSLICNDQTALSRSRTPGSSADTTGATLVQTATVGNTIPRSASLIQTTSPRTPLRKGSEKKKAHLNSKQKMKALRDEKQLEKILKKKEEWKALSKQNAAQQKNNKLQGFLANNSTELKIADRINSLLQL